MCGIIGSINFPIENSLLDLIRHRGPDRQSIYNDSAGKHNISFAHARLSIVDLSDAGNQPMISEDENYYLIFNGEIYNHLQLREKLKFKNFRGHSDTETILYYLIENGIDAIKDFNGIFAFAFYDKKEKTVFLARDRYGVKPLYYYKDSQKMIFSSEIRPIKKVINTSLDSDSLNLLLNLRYCPSPATLYKGIYKIRPGHYAEIDLKKDNLNIILKPFIEKYGKRLDISFNDAVNQYGDLFEKAIKRQLMSDVEVGVLLSGGIDSALVAGIASKYLPYKLKAYTVGFDSSYSVNELEMAHNTAKYFGLDHKTVKINSRNFFDIFHKCSGIVEEPIATTSIIPMYYLSELASKDVKVVLTGQGADEPLGGYNKYQCELYKKKFPNILFKIVSGLINMSGTKNENLIKGAHALTINDDIKRFNNIYSTFSEDEITKLTGSSDIPSNKYIAYYYNLLNCKSMKGSAEKMMAMDLHMNLSDDLLLYTDKITMNFSMECRVPLLDLPLVDFIMRLPESYKLKIRKTKIIHKEYAKSMLPQSIINRPKYGFLSPTDLWFREDMGRIKDMLLSSDNIMLQHLDKKEIENILNLHKKGINKEKQIFLLLSLYEWAQSMNN